MGYGVNDAARTTNDLLTQFVPTIVPKLEELDVFGRFFKEEPKPAGVGTTVNYVVDVTTEEAERQAPGAKRVSRQRDAFEVDIVIPDKFRASAQIVWEKVRQGRFNEVEKAVQLVINAGLRARVRELGRFLFTAAAQNSGTPTDPTLPANGQTPYWWNSNDTQAPATYGETTFAVGHDHVETAVTALTLDRIRVYMASILEHGYGDRGLFMAVQTQEERVLLQLANAVQQNQTAGVKLRDEFQGAFRASGLNGVFGLEIGVNQYVPAGVVGMWDANLAGLPMGGAVRVVDLAPTPDTEEEKGTQSTWVEMTEQFGAGILHKAAGYTAHVA